MHNAIEVINQQITAMGALMFYSVALLSAITAYFCNFAMKEKTELRWSGIDLFAWYLAMMLTLIILGSLIPIKVFGILCAGCCGFSVWVMIKSGFRFVSQVRAVDLIGAGMILKITLGVIFTIRSNF